MMDQIVNLTTETHPNRPMHFTNLAIALQTRSERTRSSEDIKFSGPPASRPSVRGMINISNSRNLIFLFQYLLSRHLSSLIALFGVVNSIRLNMHRYLSSNRFDDFFMIEYAHRDSVITSLNSLRSIVGGSKYLRMMFSRILIMSEKLTCLFICEL